MASGEIIKVIEDKLMQRPRLKSIENTLSPTNATVEEFHKSSKTADINFFSQTDGMMRSVKNVEIRMMKGVNGGSLDVGEEVLIVFPSGKSHIPLIVASFGQGDMGKNAGATQGVTV